MWLTVAMLVWLFTRPWLSRKLGLMAESVLLFGWIWAWWNGILPPQFFYWKNLPLYLSAGVVLYFVSCFITGVPIAFLQSLYRRPALNNFWWWRIVLISPLHEEIIWRLAAQSLLVISLAQLGDIGRILALIFISVSFTFWHRVVWKQPRNAFELMLFSLILGASIAWQGDLLLSLCLHMVRNFLILQRPVENEIS